MQPPVPDRALRLMVAELAELRPEDVEAVLDMLDPAHRHQVEQLVDQYAGMPARAWNAGKSRVDLDVLSPWLAERIRSADQMSFQTAELLRQCAEAVLPRTVLVEEGKPSLLQQLIDRLPRWRWS